MNEQRRTRGAGNRTLSVRAPLLLLALLVTLGLAGCGNESGGGKAATQSQTTSAPSAANADADGTAAHADHSQHAEHAAQGHDQDHAEHGEAAADHAAQDHAAQDHGAHDHQHAETLAAAPLPGTSIYHLTTSFTDHHEQPMALPDLRGNASVFVMFYGDCTTACPLLVRSAEEIEAALPGELRDETQFVMVSFDTERDTPKNLLAYAQDKGLDKENWHWLVGTPLQTRQLATLLGVQYRDAGNGVFAHSNLVTVVDPDGVPTARLEGIVTDVEPAVTAIVSAGAVND